MQDFGAVYVRTIVLKIISNLNRPNKIVNPKITLVDVGKHQATLAIFISNLLTLELRFRYCACCYFKSAGI